MKEFLQIVDSLYVPVIDATRNYWLVRTESGNYYEDFCKNNYIALGWDELLDLELIKTGDFERLKEIIIEKYPDQSKPGHAARQLYRFVKEMKKGDVVLIPSESSSYITLGILLDDEIYLEPTENLKYLELGQCPYIKRRKVKWLTTKSRNEIDPYLYKLLNSHYGLTTANLYEHYIDRTIYPIFIKDNVGHLIFEVSTREKIRAVDLISFIQNTLSSIDVYNALTNKNINKADIDITLNVQSPGHIELSGYYAIILGIAVLGVVLAGGTLKISCTKEKQEGEISTEGLIEKINKFLAQRRIDTINLKRLEADIKMSTERLKVQMPPLIVTDPKDDQNTD